MTEVKQGRQRKMKRLALLAALVLALVAVLVVPPLLSVNRYKSRIAQLMSASLSRPVRLSQVSVRLLPRPCFELTDLTVEEDPAFGAEPVLHANSVTAYIRLLSLWRGRLEIGTVSVDEASFNLVRNAEGRWNLDALFRNAAKAQSGAAKALIGADGNASGPARRLPLLEATSSRINIKNGNEKLPFSILNTDLTFRHEISGEWRLELRGQPARTDLSLELADTGVVRLNANGRQAPELRVMPVHVDMDWRDAQLGQLTKLLIGIDPGWRGDLTGELQVDGTAEAAQVKTRLRAERVHRAEFAPPAPMDFDANCGFVYHYTSRSLENLACDSPLGAGRIHIEGALPGEAGHPHLSVQLARVPVQAALDALRTVRSGFGPGLEAQGMVSGKIAYAPLPASEKPPAQANRHPSPPRQAPANPVTGSLVVEGFELGGDVLTTPIRAPRVVLEPVTAPGQPYMLAATVAVPAGGKSPLSITARLALSGYQITVHGQASIARTRELARMGGMRSASILDGLAGEPISIDIGAQGPWMQLQEDATAGIGRQSLPRRMSGTFEFHNANWKSDSLANHVQISQATLHFEDGQIRWDPVAFSFGPLKGAASLAMLKIAGGGKNACRNSTWNSTNWTPLPCNRRSWVRANPARSSLISSTGSGSPTPRPCPRPRERSRQIPSSSGLSPSRMFRPICAPTP